MKSTWAIVAGLSTFTAVAGISLTIRDVRIETDCVTGSTRTKTERAFGLIRYERIEPSRLENALRQRQIAWTPQWQLISQIEYRMVSVARGCTSAPPIHSMSPVMSQWADTKSDAELRDFVTTMTSGTEAQQKATMDASVAEVLGRAM